MTNFQIDKGRTARIGNEGLATSFYNEGDSGIAPDLVKVMLECRQIVPDFLSGYKPSDNKITFDDDNTDSEGTEGTDSRNKNASAWEEGGADKDATGWEEENTDEKNKSPAFDNSDFDNAKW